MCGKRIKIGLSGLLCWLLLLAGPTCWASTYQATEQEMQTLRQNSQRLAEINSILQLNSTDSQKTLLQVSKELSESKAELITLKQELATLQATLLTARNLSQSQQELLAKTNESFQTYSKEMNSKINSLRRDRTTWEVIAGIILVGAIDAYVKK